MDTVQLKGNLKLGADDSSETEYGDAISEFTIETTREEVVHPATLATGRAWSSAGALKEQLRITFSSSTAAASVWAELYDLIIASEGEMYFEGTLNPGAVSADNPKFSGTVAVLGLTTGGTVGKLREQTQTFPLNADGVTKVTA